MSSIIFFVQMETELLASDSETAKVGVVVDSEEEEDDPVCQIEEESKLADAAPLNTTEDQIRTLRLDIRNLIRERTTLRDSLRRVKAALKLESAEITKSDEVKSAAVKRSHAEIEEDTAEPKPDSASLTHSDKRVSTD